MSKKIKPFRHGGLPGYLSSGGIFLITLLWSYAVLVKLADLEIYKRQMSEQPFSVGIIYSLLILVPLLELLAATLLIVKKYRTGLSISMALLICFTIYITLILFKVFPTAPCSCGGFISKLSWKSHLYFNMFCISLNAFCLVQTKKERRLTAKEEK